MSSDSQILKSGGGGPCHETKGIFKCSQCEDEWLDEVSLDAIRAGNGLCAGGRCYDAQSLEQWGGEKGGVKRKLLPHRQGVFTNSQIKAAMEEGKDYCDEDQKPVEEKGEVLGAPLPRLAGPRRRLMRRNVPRRRRIDDREAEIKDGEEAGFFESPVEMIIFFIVVAFIMYWLILLSRNRNLPFIDRPYFPPGTRGGKSRRTSKPPSQEEMEETIEYMFSDAETFNKILAASILLVPLTNQKEFKNFMMDLRHNPWKFKEWVSENPDILNKVFRESRRHFGEFRD